MLVIRDVAERDAPAVRDVLVATWHHTYDPIFGPEKVEEIVNAWHTGPRLTAEVGQPNAAFLVAEREGRAVATASAHRGDDGPVCLNRLYVLPEEQGTGVGRRLLQVTLGRFPGAARVWLEVAPRNAAAIAFYERQGFRAEGPRASCGDRNDLASIIMAKMARPSEPVVRPAEDRDAQDLFGLLSLCFAEYPGCFVDSHGDLPDLREPAASFARKGGAFWVVEDESGRACACVAVDFPESGMAELHRLYVRPDQRRQGLGEILVRLVEDEARRRGAAKMFFWSDTRFTGAHRLYRRLGYAGGGITRDLGDISNSVEYRFEKPL
jgi:GNAT superfamily N-acetyltransferase